MKLKILLPLLVLGIVAAVVLRSCNSTEVVVEENADTVKVKKMMSDIVLQQQQTGGTTPSTVPAP